MIDLRENVHLQNTSYSQTCHSLQLWRMKGRLQVQAVREGSGCELGACSEFSVHRHAGNKIVRAWSKRDTYLILPLSLYPWEREELPQTWTSCYGPDLAPCLCLSLSPRTRPRRPVAACSSGLLWLWASWRACGPCNGPLLGSKTHTVQTDTHMGRRKKEVTSCISKEKSTCSKY